PGLNACLRAVVRTALASGLKVLGIRHGYEGLMAGEVIPLDHSSVSGIINRGGTFLHTARSENFTTPEGIEKACRVIAEQGIEGLVVLGGNGSLHGAWDLARKTPAAVLGIPKSIDNDVGGTDFSIGFDTAVNTAVEVIDKIRDTATSHDRLFLVETMGRKRGFLALATALAAGAEAVLLPEVVNDLETLCKKLDQGKGHGKVSSIVVVAEGEEEGGAIEIARKIKKYSGYDVRVSVIGYQQRGGAPSAFDRILASQFGNRAVEALVQGEKTKMAGIQGGKMVLVPLDSAWKIEKTLDASLLRLAELLSR
ncbi:MAG: ATP-dependent 6-phosphofructokinase, partial [Candidatus Omnitrophica bacterium]|nr:ATP-dependent 6-phosphofructokinase [Candidatus Omnitrophota bacterium]